MRAVFLLLLCACAHVEPLRAAQITRLREAGALTDACPVQPADLARVGFTYHPLGGGPDATGELVVHRLLAAEVEALMRVLYDAGFPLESARPIEDFNGSDDASMAANNTSAFNCRAKTPALLPDGTPAPVEYSVHSYGAAIDINPRKNPYFKPRDVAEWNAWRERTAAAASPENLDAFCLEDAKRCTLLPPGGRLDRSPQPGVLRAGDPVVTAFKARGWRWGGDWPSGPNDKVRTDTQHFERDVPVRGP
jgi:poly-gamma-glutamate synthesis protein (capsule biosynthesis protein)